MIYRNLTFGIVVLSFLMTSASIAEASSRVFVYQMKNGEVVFKTCPTGKIQKNRDCVGSSFSNKVAPEYFEKVLWAPYLIVNSDKMKPLSEDEAKAFQTSGINPKEILKKRKSNLLYKLGLIEKLVSEDKSNKNALKLLSRAKEQLISSDPSSTDVLKLNDLIKKILLNRMNSDGNPNIIKPDSPSSQALWRQFDGSLPECGTNESHTIEQRISDCSNVLGPDSHSKKVGKWKLVARKKNEDKGKYYEVWKDTQTGLIWGDLLEKTLPFYFLVDVNEKGEITKDKICSSDVYGLARAFITKQTFALPTISELEQALQNGLGEVTPNMNHWHWSATSFPNEYLDMAWGITSGVTQFRDFDFKYYYSGVRCVGRTGS